MSRDKVKVFRDPVHGYIPVSSWICECFIDTPIFQRLRSIEQTSMRPLFPAARHDRFAHSMGVFHLAGTAFSNLLKNTKPALLRGVKIRDYERSFLAAALLHDCGHAPFSHIFEEYLNQNSRAERLLFSLAGKEFERDYNQNYDQGKGPAAHEVFSAAIFLKHYKDSFNQFAPNKDPVLVARMITGCVHPIADTTQKEVENCLIRLINGPAIDMDKLDYILRDTWASGINNASIDVQRLLSAIRIDKYGESLRPVFDKSALSVIQSVIDGRNHLYRWIYSHHTVQYYCQLLKDALLAVSKIVSPVNDPDKMLDVIFSEAVFETQVKVSDDVSFYLPCDGDILYLLKRYYPNIPEAQEILGRRPRRLPLWKTQAEFDLIFASKDRDERNIIRANAQDTLFNKLGIPRDSTLAIPVKPSPVEIRDIGRVIVSLRGSTHRYSEIVSQPATIDSASYFLVFISRDYSDKTSDCIKALSSVKAYS